MNILNTLTQTFYINSSFYALQVPKAKETKEEEPKIPEVIPNENTETEIEVQKEVVEDVTK